ncbi:YadA family autotransporter adhesin, partial [Ursidibacter sp. B-7004-1]
GENGEVIHKALGEQLDIVGDSKNVSTTNEDGKIKITMSDNPNFTSLNTTEGATIGGKLEVTGPATFNDKVTANKGLEVNGSTTLNNGATIKGGDLVMSDNKITGLADGTDAKDAVNKGQLDAAISGSGWNLKVNDETTSEKIANDQSAVFKQGKNIVISRQGNTVTVATSDNPTFDSLTTTGDATIGGNQTVKGDQTVDGNQNVKGNQTVEKDLTVEGNTNIGGEGKTFTVKEGTTVNMGGNKVENITSGEIKAGDNNAVTGDAVNTKVQELIDGGLKFMGNDGSIITTKLGEQLNVVGGATTAGNYSSANVKTTADGTGNITIEFAENPEFNNITAKGDLTVNGTSNLKDTNIDGNQKVTGNSEIGGDQTVKGNQTVEKDLTVNGTSNLKDTNINGNQKVTGNSEIGGDQTVKGNQTVEKGLTVNGTSNLKNTNVDGNLVVNGKTNIKGDLNMEGNRITNVGRARDNGDAVNLGQVNEIVGKVDKGLRDKISKVDKRLRGGIAGSTAVANIPQVTKPGANLVGLGVANYNGQSAVAVGYSRMSDNGKVILKLSAGANTSKDFNVGGGIGYQW